MSAEAHEHEFGEGKNSLPDQPVVLHQNDKREFLSALVFLRRKSQSSENRYKAAAVT